MQIKMKKKNNNNKQQLIPTHLTHLPEFPSHILH